MKTWNKYDSFQWLMKLGEANTWPDTMEHNEPAVMFGFLLARGFDVDKAVEILNGEYGDDWLPEDELKEQDVEEEYYSSHPPVHYLNERIEDMTNILEQVLGCVSTDKEEIINKHFNALYTFVTTGGRDLDEFAKQFPRTWNAIKSNDPSSFALDQ